ncbi:uncharacterized protein LOC141620885 [Silene latifolia]|uniref:uncharacterized protein LOC141620885 n=1 Tax=Silene latifolia TaxID=37657 RepID=UPI003D776194
MDPSVSRVKDTPMTHIHPDGEGEVQSEWNQDMEYLKDRFLHDKLPRNANFDSIPEIPCHPELETLDTIPVNRIRGENDDRIDDDYLAYQNLTSLQLLHSEKTGELDYLTHLDLSWNSLSRTIPHAIGNLEFLRYLDLSQNSLSGIIPDAISNLQSLLHLDLSNNSLSGQIASTIYFSGYLGTMHSLSYLNLSYNRLDGSIPSLLGGGASSLSHLDLSNNQLEGAIPSSIANLEYLGYLDLSRNNLTGDIPCKLEITKPPYFADFSYNDLSGSIPKHLSYLGPDSFKGNTNFHTDEIQGLCDKDDDKIDRGLYVSIILGFYTGFWAFCGILIVKSSWRHAYFRFFNHIKDKIYEIVVVNLIDQIYVIVVVSLARYRRNSQVYR